MTDPETAATEAAAAPGVPGPAPEGVAAPEGAEPSGPGTSPAPEAATEAAEAPADLPGPAEPGPSAGTPSAAGPGGCEHCAGQAPHPAGEAPADLPPEPAGEDAACLRCGRPETAGPMFDAGYGLYCSDAAGCEHRRDEAIIAIRRAELARAATEATPDAGSDPHARAASVPS